MGTNGKTESDAKRGYLIRGAFFAASPLPPALYVVATPIGNLSDVTLRALDTLAAADLVACEDTRVTRRLLDRYGIAARVTAYHEHSGASAHRRLLDALAEGKSVALVCDAGTPLLSDPGAALVADAVAAGHRVVPIPGASAIVATLSAAGLPTDAFLFVGFLPTKSAARRKRLAALVAIPATLVFFELPNRVAAFLADAAEALGGEREATLCREVTKISRNLRPWNAPRACGAIQRRLGEGRGRRALSAARRTRGAGRRGDRKCASRSAPDDERQRGGANGRGGDGAFAA